MSLGIPLSYITVQDGSTQTLPDASATGGSITSGLNSAAIMQACANLNAALAPYKSQLGPSATWLQIITAAIAGGANLEARGWADPGASSLGPQQYNSYCAVVTEVQVDVLTGEIQILRCDILFDCGISMNPAIDIGQVQGAFIQGLSLHTTEELLYDLSDTSGALITNGTWEYKPFCSQDIPIDFRVSLLKNAPNPLGILKSKAVGEPPLTLGCSVIFAIRHAITAALADQGNTNPYSFNSPATVENIQQTINPQLSQYTLS